MKDLARFISPTPGQRSLSIKKFLSRVKGKIYFVAAGDQHFQHCIISRKLRVLWTFGQMESWDFGCCGCHRWSKDGCCQNDFRQSTNVSREIISQTLKLAKTFVKCYHFPLQSSCSRRLFWCVQIQPNVQRVSARKMDLDLSSKWEEIGWIVLHGKIIKLHIKRFIFAMFCYFLRNCTNVRISLACWWASREWCTWGQTRPMNMSEQSEKTPLSNRSLCSPSCLQRELTSKFETDNVHRH